MIIFINNPDIKHNIIETLSNENIEYVGSINQYKNIWNAIKESTRIKSYSDDRKKYILIEVHESLSDKIDIKLLEILKNIEETEFGFLNLKPAYLKNVNYGLEISFPKLVFISTKHDSPFEKIVDDLNMALTNIYKNDTEKSIKSLIEDSASAIKDFHI